MKILTFILLTMTSLTTYSQDNDSISKKIIEIEKMALEKWNNGNPSGYLEIMAKDIVYFDDLTEKRLDGFGKVKQLFESVRGKIKVDSYEMINPLVQSDGNMAVLTYNLIATVGDKTEKWNATQIYQKDKDGKWKIIHMHMSLTQSNMNK